MGVKNAEFDSIQEDAKKVFGMIRQMKEKHKVTTLEFGCYGGGMERFYGSSGGKNSFEGERGGKNGRTSDGDFCQKKY